MDFRMLMIISGVRTGFSYSQEWRVKIDIYKETNRSFSDGYKKKVCGSEHMHEYLLDSFMTLPSS